MTDSLSTDTGDRSARGPMSTNSQEQEIKVVVDEIETARRARRLSRSSDVLSVDPTRGNASTRLNATLRAARIRKRLAMNHLRRRLSRTVERPPESTRRNPSEPRALASRLGHEPSPTLPLPHFGAPPESTRRNQSRERPGRSQPPPGRCGPPLLAIHEIVRAR